VVFEKPWCCFGLCNLELLLLSFFGTSSHLLHEGFLSFYWNYPLLLVRNILFFVFILYVSSSNHLFLPLSPLPPPITTPALPLPLIVTFTSSLAHLFFPLQPPPFFSSPPLLNKSTLVSLLT